MLNLRHPGRFVSVFGTIPNRSQATLWHAVDNNTQAAFTTPTVSRNVHQALLFTEYGLDDGDHTLEVSFINSTVTPLDGDSCLSIDFFAYHLPPASSIQTCDTDHPYHDMQVHTGPPARSNHSTHTRGGAPTSRGRPVKIALIVGLTMGTLFLAIGCIGLPLLLFWHKRRNQKWQTLKDTQTRGPSVTASPTSPTGLGTIVPFLDTSRPSPPPSSKSAALATVDVPPLDGQSLQRSDTTLPPYPQSEEADRFLTCRRSGETIGC